MPYGWRMIRAKLFGLFLCLVWWLLTWPPHYGGEPLSDGAWLLYPFLVLMALSFAADSWDDKVWWPGRYIDVSRTDPDPSAADTKFGKVLEVLAPLLGIGILVLVIRAGYLQYKVWRPEIEAAVELGRELSEKEQQKLAWSYAARFGWLILFSVLAVLPYVLFWYVPSLLVLGIEKIKENATMRRWFLSGRGGSARWAGPATYNRHQGRRGKGIFMGKTLFEDDLNPRQVVIEDDSHLLTIGCPGSGKSVTSIWPNLLEYTGGVIVIDPKGEHAKMTLGRRQGTPIYERDTWQARDGTDKTGVSEATPINRQMSAWVLDPFKVVGCYATAHYNLLSEIDVTDNYARTMISAISKSCITVSEGDNKFWEETSRQVLDGAIAHVLSTRPKEEHNLPAVADLLLGVDPATGVISPDRLADVLAEMAGNNAAGGLPQRAAMLFTNLGERAYGNVTAELMNALKWCTDPAMRPVLSKSDFSLEYMSLKTVYVAIPFAAMTEQARWLRCFSEIAMQLALRRRENNPKPSPPTLFILDELPQYGRQLSGIKEGMVTLRDAGMKLWAFVQNRQQLVDCFGEEGAANFESGATIQVYGVRDEATAAWVSKKLGQHGVTRRVWRRWKFFFYRIFDRREERELVDPATITRELRQGSPIEFVFTSKGLPMRLARRAFRQLRVDGELIRGGKCEGADEHLRPS